MPVVNYFDFWCSLGSLLVATLGTPMWIAPRFFAFGRILVGWLMAAVAIRAIADAPGLLLNASEATQLVRDLQAVGVMCSMVLFAEGGRCVAHVLGKKPLSPWWHVPVGLTCAAHLALMMSPELAQRAGPLGHLTWLGPLALAGSSIFGLWQALIRHLGIRVPMRRTVLKFAVVGFASSNFFALVAAPHARDLLATAPIWLAVGGLSALVLTLPEFRRRVAIIMVASIIAVPFLGPFLSELNVRLAAQRFESHALEIAEGGRNLRNFSFRLGEAVPPPGGPTAEKILAEHLRGIRQQDNALRDAYFWTLRDGHVWRYTATGNTVALVDYRRAFAEEQHAPGQREFFFARALNSDEGGIVAAHARVTASAGDSPVWLAVEYPAAIWTIQTDSARRNGASMVALFAVLMAVALVLASVQAVENARHTRLQRAEGANRAKREFLAFLSHELRTPLQSVLGRAELLQRSSLATPERNQVGSILEDGRLLLRLVTDLLDLGAIEAGRLQLRPAPFVMRDALESLVASYQAQAEYRGLTLRLEIAPEVPEVVHADEGRLRQMLGNFLSNGLKYTEQGGVTMRVRTPDAAAGAVCPVEFVVSDTGPGVPPAQIDRLFSLFTRVDAGNVRRREGTGVGLALVRRLCKIMGGEVRAANRPEGGAEFTLRLNFPVAARADLKGIEYSGEASVSAHGRRALVVEDNPSARGWLVDALTALGFSVEAVRDGEAALAAAAGDRLDLVMMDINLPGRDGMEVARDLRARHPNLSIIGCSAEAFSATRDAALAAGMNGYLTKPVSLTELEKAVGQPAAAPRDLFARLHSADTTLRAQARLRADWPGMREQTERILAAGDHGALRKLSHYLKSTALLTQDETLSALCERYSGNGNGAMTASEAGPDFFAQVESHIASWPTSSDVQV